MSEVTSIPGRSKGLPSATNLPFREPTASELLAGGVARLQQHALDISVVKEVAAELFARRSPFSPADVSALSTRRIPSFYAPDFVAKIDRTMIRVLTSGGRLFVRGTALGVGVSTLLSDVARSFNFMAQKNGYRERVLYVQLTEVNSSKQLLRVLCERARCPLTHTDARLQPTDILARRFVVAANRLGVSTIMIDHAHKASGSALEAIAGLMSVSDPAYDVPLDVTEYQDVTPRFGVIVASHKPAERLFRTAPEVLHSLTDSGELVVEPFADVESLAAALRRSDLGLDDLDLTDSKDRLMVDWIMAVTRGRLSLITPLLQLLDLMSRVNGGARPNIAMLNAVLPFQRTMRQLVLRWTEPELMQNADRTWPSPHALHAGSEVRKRGNRKGRAATLREQQKHKDAAEKERRRLNKRQNVNLPGM